MSETATVVTEKLEPSQKRDAPQRIRQLLRDRRDRDARIAELERENSDLRGQIVQQATGIERQSSAEQRRIAEAQATFQRGLQLARTRHPDLDAAFEGAVMLPAEVLDALVRLGELGAEASYHLAKNPRFCHELCALLPRVAAFRAMRFAFDIERAAGVQAQTEQAAQWYRTATQAHFTAPKKGH